MSQFVFGSGLMFAQLEEGGIATPTEFGALQEVSLDFTASLKELFGSYQSPIAIARGTMKINGKAKMGKFQGSVIRDLFFRSQSQAGGLKVVNREAHTVPSAPAYTVTVANPSDFAQDLGVIYAATGLPLDLVDDTPAEGQYSFNLSTGVYTFAAADASAGVGISYAYNDMSGQVVTLSNQLLGQQPIWSLVLSNEFNGKQLNIKMNRCVASKFTFANKLEDWNLPDFEFGCFADDANIIGTMWLSEKS